MLRAVKKRGVVVLFMLFFAFFSLSYISYAAPAPPQPSRGINWIVIGLIILILGVIAAWLLSIKMRGKKAESYLKIIDKVYKANREKPVQCDALISRLRLDIEKDFLSEKINDRTLAILDARLDRYSAELRGEIIEKVNVPASLHSKIDSMLSDGKITNEEYASFKKALEGLKIKKKDKEKLEKLMKKWKKEDSRNY